MKKLICLSLISLVCGFLSVHASIQADDTNPLWANGNIGKATAKFSWK